MSDRLACRLVRTRMAVVAAVTLAASLLGLPAAVGATAAAPTPTNPLSVSVTTRFPTYGAAGSPLAFDITVVNSGDAALNNVVVQLARSGFEPATCRFTQLAGHTATGCDVRHTTTAADVSAGTVGLTAVATGFAPSGQPVVSPPGSASSTLNLSQDLVIGAVVAQASIATVGEALHYTYGIVNTGSRPLTSLAVRETRPGVTVTCPGASLAAGATMYCAGTGTTTLSDLQHRSADSAATATALEPDGTPTISAGATTTVPATATAELAVQVISQPPPYSIIGQQLFYDFRVTNTGALPVRNLHLSATRGDSSSCRSAQVAPGAATDCELLIVTDRYDLSNYDPLRTQSVVRVLGDVSLPGTQTRTYASAAATVWTPYAAAPPSPPPFGRTSLSVFSAITPEVYGVDSDTTIHYLVRNTGDEPLHDVGLIDTLPDHPGSCGARVLAPGASFFCEAHHRTFLEDQDRGQIFSSAVAIGHTTGYRPVVSAPATATARTTHRGGADLVVTASTSAFRAAGERITIDYAVINRTDVTFFDIAITDALPGVSPATCAIPVSTSAVTHCTASYVTTQADVDRAHVAPTAVATGIRDTGPPAVSAPARRLLVRPAAAQLTIAKTLTSGPFQAAGDQLAYSYRVTNRGSGRLTDVLVNDALANVGRIACPASALDPGESMTCTASYPATAADVQAGQVVNSAWAGGTTALGQSAVSNPSAVASPRQRLDLATWTGQVAFSGVGQTITVLYLVTNTGDTPLTVVGLRTDSALGPNPTCPRSTLAAGGNMICTANRTTTVATVGSGGYHETAVADWTLTGVPGRLRSNLAATSIPYVPSPAGPRGPAGPPGPPGPPM